MRSMVSIESRIKSLRSQKAACTRRITESRQAINNAQAFAFDPVRVARTVDFYEVTIANAQRRIDWIDSRIAELLELSKRTAWIEVTSSSVYSSFTGAAVVEGGK